MSGENGPNAQAHDSRETGSAFRPYVAATESPAEFTVKALVSGILFGILFGAANAYLGLQAGLTISTSIPVAVMTVAAFRVLKSAGHAGTILEANMSQTVGSASSSVASGVIFTLPALFLWGMPPDLLQMTLLAMCGGLLGVLFMIPLRQFLIEREHANLPYPEGTACAEVLVATEVGGGQARNVFLGLGVGALFKAVFGWAKLFPGVVKIPLPLKAQLGLKMSPALFGVGYILGPKIGAIMVGGGLLSSIVIIPLIGLWGADRAEPLYPELHLPIAEMGPGEIWEKYVRYIGAGAVATAGVITLIRSVPMMLESFRVGTRQLADRFQGRTQKVLRTSHDLPLTVVAVGAGVILLIMAFVPQVFGELGGVLVHLVAAVCVIIFSFFFVTVASRIVGLVGVTSNPTSGMTIAALIGTSAVFLLMGWTDDLGKASALCVGCVVAIAASISGDTSQDLKTGYLLGATPRRQQIGELIGVITAAAFVCLTVMMLGKQPDAGFGSETLPAPQATLMRLVIDGILEQKLPWALVGIGAGIAVVVEVLRLPSLPFAVGVYLPVTTMVPVFLGGLLRHILTKRASSKEAADARREKGVLFGSGLVGGEGLLGVGIAGAAFYYGKSPSGFGSDWASNLAQSIGASPKLAAVAPSILALVALGLLIWTFARFSTDRQ